MRTIPVVLPLGGYSTIQVSFVPPPCDEFTTSEPSFNATRVWLDGRDVSDRIMDLYVDVNAVDNVVQASVTLYRPHWFTTDEVATIDLL